MEERRVLRFTRLLSVYGLLAGLLVVPNISAQVVRRLDGQARQAVVPNRYVVELSGDAVLTRLLAERKAAGGNIKLNLRSRAAEKHRLAVRAEQVQARGRIGAIGGEVIESVEDVANELFVRIPDAKAAQLAALPGVKRVVADRLMYPSLDRAVQIHKAPEVWAAVGEDKAGLGSRVAVIDTGVDNGNPALQDDSLPTIPGFPQVSNNINRPFTNRKVIVARSYPRLWGTAGDPDTTARDRVGHGTAVSVVVAGVRTPTQYSTIEGMAPKAYIGNYKVYGTPGYNDGATNSAILKAISDALGDGMDVVNLSSGSDLAQGDVYLDEVYDDILKQLTDAGVLFVTSAGNSGPDLNTISSPANLQQSISVGAISNDRIFASTAVLSGGDTFIASPLTGEETLKSISGKIVDAQTFDKTNEACTIPSGANLRGAIVVLSYPPTGCTFSQEYRGLVTAGIIGAILVLPATEGPSVGFGYFIGPANPPLSYVDYVTGQAIRASLAKTPDQTVTLSFNITPQTVSYRQFAGFSSFGPTVSGGIKPDLLAVGTSIVTGTQKFDKNGEMYDATGFTITNGTSFAAPMVAGAAALLKSARPGLQATQYRSLLINSATPFLPDGSLINAPVQQAGSGVLDVAAAYKNTVTVEPTSVAFGVQGYFISLTQSIRLTNISNARETYTLSTTSRSGSGRVPRLGVTTVTLDPGQQRDVTVILDNATLAAGAIDGFINIRGSASGVESHVPYYYVVPGKPTRILLLSQDTTAAAGVADPLAFFFRIYDDNGVPLTSDVKPTVTVVSGGGAVLSVSLTDLSGTRATWTATVRMGATPGPNVFRIQSGDATQDVTINGISGY